MPAPQRGEIVRQFGETTRKQRGFRKIGFLRNGEIFTRRIWREMIDICDFAVGLSRQLHGLTMHSERPQHRMYEQYHSLGVVGIISAFNFPVAVWAWNTALAWIAGDAFGNHQKSTVVQNCLSKHNCEVKENNLQKEFLV
jgi:aldehyde dehydrogenase (NAD+)